ncbi:MAG: hypothetical protein ACRD52_16195, partial [Candidatus Acidiferrales bacterium]
MLAWLVVSWPHFRPAMNLYALSRLILLALLANVCYSAAYFVDVAMQWFMRSGVWARGRCGWPDQYSRFCWQITGSPTRYIPSFTDRFTPPAHKQGRRT